MLKFDIPTATIFIIIDNLNQIAQKWHNRPLDTLYLIVWMGGIIFNVRNNGNITNNTVYLCIGLKQNE